MYFFNFWFMLTVAIAGYYILEYKKAERLGFKDEKEIYSGGLLVTKGELHKVIGIKERDVKSLLQDYQDKLVVHSINNKEYYSVENLKQVLNIPFKRVPQEEK
ncbi:hypothetical protein P4575_27520 [Priestia megaterium]|uniref:hypothetical protein n=1 Tax=Priestia megaterium TaxID=1404 RepID=UPI002E228073|nr:hypothetical protein [Priestia megaterium]